MCLRLTSKTLKQALQQASSYVHDFFAALTIFYLTCVLWLENDKRYDFTTDTHFLQ